MDPHAASVTLRRPDNKRRVAMERFPLAGGRCPRLLVGAAVAGQYVKRGRNGEFHAPPECEEEEPEPEWPNPPGDSCPECARQTPKFMTIQFTHTGRQYWPSDYPVTLMQSEEFPCEWHRNYEGWTIYLSVDVMEWYLSFFYVAANQRYTYRLGIPYPPPPIYCMVPFELEFNTYHGDPPRNGAPVQDPLPIRPGGAAA